MTSTRVHLQPNKNTLPSPIRSADQVVAIIATNDNGINVFLSRGSDGKLHLPCGDMQRGEWQDEAMIRLAKEKFQISPESINSVGTFRYKDGSIFAFEIISYQGTIQEQEMGTRAFFPVLEIPSIQKEVDPVDFQIIGHYWNYYDPGLFIFDKLMPDFKPRRKPWSAKKRKGPKQN